MRKLHVVTCTKGIWITWLNNLIRKAQEDIDNMCWRVAKCLNHEEVTYSTPNVIITNET